VQWRAVLERERKVMRELDEIKHQKIEERQARKKIFLLLELLVILIQGNQR